MKRAVALLPAALLLLPLLALAQEKPEAALGRVATLGEVSEAQKKIITNRLEGSLPKFYDLVSQEQYARAEEEAFKSLDLAQCTAEQCIRKIQELLQVDRLFVLQIIREEQVTQLTLNLVREILKENQFKWKTGKGLPFKLIFLKNFPISKKFRLFGGTRPHRQKI